MLKNNFNCRINLVQKKCILFLISRKLSYKNDHDTKMNIILHYLFEYETTMILESPKSKNDVVVTTTSEKPKPPERNNTKLRITINLYLS